jgi:hypothetical protein
MSIVIPRFGDVADFWDEAEVYELEHGTVWHHVAAPEKAKRFTRSS